LALHFTQFYENDVCLDSGSTGDGGNISLVLEVYI